MSAITTSFALLLLSLSFLIVKYRYSNDRRLPPGPPRTPIIGNVLQIEANFPQLKFTRWAREYGDTISLKIFGQTIVILSSASAVRLVLDKHGTYTGHRLPAYTNDISTGNPHFVNRSIDSDYFKNGRKAIHTFFTPEALKNYREAQKLEYVQLLHDLLETPSDIIHHIQRTVASLIISLVYGKRCPHFANSEAETFFEMMKLRMFLAEPKAHPPLDVLPFLKLVPARWARWKRLAARCAALRIKLQNGLLSECEDRMKAGMGVGCHMESVLANQQTFNMSWDEISGVGGVLLDGGIETTSSFLQSLVVVLLNYPEVQQRAQKEIDLIVGAENLPTLEDVSDIPYIKALIKEVHRFRTLLPLAIPHSAGKDIVLSDYTIPNGALILMNTWGIFHDSRMFDEPDVFNPERYLMSEFGTKPGVDTSDFRHNFQFGAGRRLCPGEHLAMQSTELLTAFLLWAFTFSKDKSNTGGISLESYVRPGVELSPLPFSCNVTLRHESRGQVIKEVYKQLQGRKV